MSLYKVFYLLFMVRRFIKLVPYVPYTLEGPTVTRPVYKPLVVNLLDNRLHITTGQIEFQLSYGQNIQNLDFCLVFRRH